MKKKWHKYLFRLLFLVAIQLMVKIADQSFNGILDVSLRWFFFFFSFMVYWIAVWELASLSIGRIEKVLLHRVSSGRGLTIISIYAIFYIASVTLLYDLVYRWLDIRFFNMKAMWLTVPFPHPDMVYPLFIIGVLLFVADRFSRFVVLVSRAELASEKLKQENVLANFNALKNQVDPHFFFNSLSVLSSMVHSDPDMASKYIYNLSKLYRYILESKKNNMVPLYEELEFLDSYIFLMSARHDGCVHFSINISEEAKQKVGVHPNSLQLLAENAIKHNTFKKDDPLLVEVYEEAEFICVKNSLRVKNLLTPTTKIGLENIKNRYALHDNLRVIVESDTHFFTVKLPKIDIPTR